MMVMIKVVKMMVMRMIIKVVKMMVMRMMIKVVCEDDGDEDHAVPISS